MVEKMTVEEIQAEIEQEMQLKKMLDQSVSDLKVTVKDLDNKFKQVDNEGSEWKTRYETQQEMNRQLERQLESLKNKIQKSHGINKKDIVALKSLEDMSDSGLKGLVRQLEKEKLGLEGQLQDMEWRLDQESKALHKASEGRKKYVTELTEASIHLDAYKRRQSKNTERKIPHTGRPALRKPKKVELTKGKQHADTKNQQ